VRALVICATGFFPDGKWHGLAKAMRTEGEGEGIVDGTTREAFGQMLAAVAPGISEQACDEYFKAYADPVRRRGQLELYRSGDFAELEPYRGRLAALGVPTLLLFGSEDPFARVATAHRLAQEIPHARTEVLDGIGHFMFDEVPDRSAAIVVDFLRELD
jgi:haloalkane dehalogenase